MSLSRVFTFFVALSLLLVMGLTYRSAVSNSALAFSVDRSYDEIEHLRAARGPLLAADHTYDEIERIRAGRDALAEGDHSYDDIERLRSTRGNLLTGDISQDAIQWIHVTHGALLLGDHSYDEIEHLRAARDSQSVADNSYDELEHIRSSAFASTLSVPVVGMIEPKAGTWKTWVLTSGSQLRRPAPPDAAATEKELQDLKALVAKRDAAALDQIAYWDTGAPTYRWNELAATESLKANQDGNTGGRTMALVNVAMYDATIAAYDSKYTYNRLRPNELDPALNTVIANPQTPSYPSEHAAVAGAASTVLAYLFPDNAKFYTDQAEAAANSRLLAGVEFPSDVAAGLELGRAVGALVVEYARHDGSDAKWTGTVPTTPGSWNGTNPIQPLAGTWKTWVLKSGSELRPPPPYAYDSPEKAKEMAELKAIQRTPKQTADAYYFQFGSGATRNHLVWNDQANRKIFEYGLNENGPRAARVLALESVAYYDAAVACWDAKYAYWAIRPFQLDPDFKPLFTTPNHPSYPAAHGCLSGAPSALLGLLFPRDAATMNAIADTAAESRVWAGIHFRSDVVTGLALGRAVAQKVIERAQSDGSGSATASTK